MVDALDLASKDRGGEILEFEATAAPLPTLDFACSTHALGLPQAIELSRVLGSLPRRLTVLGAVGTNFAPSSGLSPAMADAVEALYERLRHHLTAKDDLSCTNTP